jgi:hypothetical protein
LGFPLRNRQLHWLNAVPIDFACDPLVRDDDD